MDIKAQTSVVIVTYDNSQDIIRCLDAILEYHSGVCEIVIVDNNSNDNTCALIESYGEHIILIKRDDNPGFATAANRAVNITKGKYLAFLNPDTAVTENWLIPLVEALEMNPQVGATTSEILFGHQPSSINTCGNTIHVSGVTYCNYYGKPIFNACPFEVSAISGAAFLIQRDVFLAIGGFEDNFFMYFEDTDLSFRLQLMGYHVLAVPLSKVIHYYQPGFTNQYKLYHLERNRYLSMLSLFDKKLLVCIAPAILYAEALSWLFASLNGKGLLGGKFRAWQSINEMKDWILLRRSKWKNGSMRGVISGFRPHLRIEYVGSKPSIIIRIAEVLGYIIAIPCIWIARRMYKLP